MLTNNFRRCAISQAFSNTQYYLYYIDMNGDDAAGGNFMTIKTLFSCIASVPLATLDTSVEKGTLIFGSSDVAEGATDYNLKSIIDDTLFTRGTTSYTNSSYQNVDGTITLVQTATYTGAEPCTIKEVGYAVRYSAIPRPMLIAREVLKQPITVNQGDTFTVSMVIQ